MSFIELDFGEFIDAVEKTELQILAAIPEIAEAGAIAGAEEAKHGPFKDRTGNLRRRIVARFLSLSAGSAEWEILAAANYASFVNDGTRPHVILPRNGVALRFEVNGTTVFARKVNHPGTSPQPFVAPALVTAEAAMRAAAERVVDKAQEIWN